MRRRWQEPELERSRQRVGELEQQLETVLRKLDNDDLDDAAVHTLQVHAVDTTDELIDARSAVHVHRTAVAAIPVARATTVALGALGAVAVGVLITATAGWARWSVAVVLLCQAAGGLWVRIHHTGPSWWRAVLASVMAATGVMVAAIALGWLPWWLVLVAIPVAAGAVAAYPHGTFEVTLAQVRARRG